MYTIYSTPGTGTTVTGSSGDQFSTLCIRQFPFSTAVVGVGMKISPNTSFVGAPGDLTAKDRYDEMGFWRAMGEGPNISLATLAVRFPAGP